MTNLLDIMHLSHEIAGTPQKDGKTFVMHEINVARYLPPSGFLHYLHMFFLHSVGCKTKTAVVLHHDAARNIDLW